MKDKNSLDNIKLFLDTFKPLSTNGWMILLDGHSFGYFDGDEQDIVTLRNDKLSVNTPYDGETGKTLRKSSIRTGTYPMSKLKEVVRMIKSAQAYEAYKLRNQNEN